MIETATPGGQPIDVELSHFAIKRVLNYINTRAASDIDPSVECYFGGIGYKDFRDIYEFSVKFEIRTIKEGIGHMAKECLKSIKATSDGFKDRSYPFHILKDELNPLIDQLTSIPWSVLGTMNVIEALHPEWIAPCLRAAFGDDLKPSSDSKVPAENFAEEFRKHFNIAGVRYSP